MKVIITGKNFNTYKHLQDTMEKKFEKLGKYFSDDITVNVVLSQERGKDKIEVTINAKGAVFRAEEVCADIYEGIDRVEVSCPVRWQSSRANCRRGTTITRL